MRTYTLTIYKMVPPVDGGLDHVALGSYESKEAPWVPRIGEYFRFRDPYPPNMPHDHRESGGHVLDVVTCFYGTGTTIEIYIGLKEP